jgi:Peptidase C13 family
VPSLKAVFKLLTFRRVTSGELSASPVLLACLWLLGSLGLGALALFGEGWPYGGAQGFVSLGMQVLAGFAVGGLLGSWDEVPRYAIAFLVLGIVAAAVPVLVRLFWRSGSLGHLAVVLAGLWMVLAAIRLIWTSAAQSLPRRRLAAMVAVAMLFPLGTNFSAVEGALADSYLPAETSRAVRIDYEALWGAQPGLLAKAAATLPPKGGRAPRIFIVSIAAGGSQAIFGREAEAMRDLFVRRLGKTAPGLLLSNGAAHHARVPLANRDNLSATLNAIGQRFDPARDLLIVYLTAHGGPNAALQTDLPDMFGLKDIDAPFLADSLAKAKIARRIVIVSACFSGTWIGPLASPDTIVLTASSATRTSFGCDDRRQYTVFGAALLEGSLGQGASWSQAFARLQLEIGELESSIGIQPSLPMASVGARMETVWNAPLGRSGAR